MALLTSDDLSQIAQNAAPPPTTAPPSSGDYSDPAIGYTAPTPEQQRAIDLQEIRRNALLAGVDTNTGAPAGVRAAVGATDDPASRLKTLQQYFPDAQSVPGTDNFVYTDPNSSSKRSYMPTGMRIPTLGDLASLGGPLAEGAGAVGGGILGTFVGGPGVGTAVGAGIGGAGAGEAYRQAAPSLLGTTDLRTPTDVVRDLGISAAVNAVAPWVGENIGGPIIKGLANMFRYGDTPASTAATALDARGVTSGLPDSLQAGVASGNKGIQRVESAVSQMPGGGRVADLDAATRGKLGDGVSTVADFATRPTGVPVPNPETFSTNVADIARDIGDQWDTTRSALDDQATSLIGKNTPVSVAPLQGLRDSIAAARDQAPVTLGPRYQPALDKLDGYLSDAGDGGTLPFQVLRNARTDLGKEIAWTPRGTVAPTGQPDLQGVYDTLKTTLQGAANDAGTDAADALAAHDSAVTGWHAPGGPAETVKALSNPALGSDALLNLSKSTAPQAQTQFASLLNQASPEQRATLTSGLIGRLGLDGQDNFNLAKFVKDWGSMTDIAKGQVFTGDQAPLMGDLNNLATVGRSVMDASGTRGHSNTAAVLGVLNAIGASAGYLLHGAPGAAAGVVAGNVGAPWAAGRLLESRPFVNWLTSSMADPSAAAWGRSVAQLGAVGSADPRLRAFATELQKRMGSEPPAQ